MNTEQHYYKLLEADPNNAQIHNKLAMLLYRNQDFDNALIHYAKAVNLKPDYIEAHYNLGLLFIKLAKPDEAITQLKNVLALDQNHILSHKLIADLYLQNNALAQAKQHYEIALELQPKQVETLNNLGVTYLKLKDPESAITCFSKAVMFDENHLDARNNLAVTYLQQDRYENALLHYQILLQQDRDNLEVHYNFGVAKMAVGDLNDAIRHFQIVLQKQPDSIDAAINIAAVYLKLNSVNKAIDCYEKVVKQDPHHPVANYMLHALRDASIGNGPEVAPAQYVKNLFDNYAGYYDKHTTEVLHYQVPALMRTAIDNLKDKTNLPWRILDLGCGSGLSGQTFHDLATRLIGIDISPKMLYYAKLKGIYDDLMEGDLLSCLSRHSLSNIGHQFNLILAADVFVYMGQLSEVFQNATRLLAENGLFVFSIETMNENELNNSKKEGFVLRRTARYAHSENYLEKLAVNSSLKIRLKQIIIPRYQDENPVKGLLYVLQKNGIFSK